DERDERASVPDHRHRCYAEPTPAPRALAHQEAYCLSSAFPVCPTFQDWARREAARANGSAAASPAAASGAIAAAVAAGAEWDPPGVTDAGPDTPADRSPATPSPGTAAEVHRNPPRDWAAPPPWLASSEAGADDDAEPPSFLNRRVSEPGQGLA